MEAVAATSTHCAQYTHSLKKEREYPQSNLHFLSCYVMPQAGGGEEYSSREQKHADSKTDRRGWKIDEGGKLNYSTSRKTGKRKGSKRRKA